VGRENSGNFCLFKKVSFEIFENENNVGFKSLNKLINNSRSLWEVRKISEHGIEFLR
jgi:hypothetical protein